MSTKRAAAKLAYTYWKLRNKDATKAYNELRELHRTRRGLGLDAVFVTQTLRKQADDVKKTAAKVEYWKGRLES